MTTMLTTVSSKTLCGPARLLALRFASTTTATTTSTTLTHNIEPEFGKTKMVRLATKDEAGEDRFVTEPAFKHPGFDKEAMMQVKFEHRPVQSFRDGLTYHFMRYLRTSFDWFTNYKEPINDAEAIQLNNTKYKMTLQKWLTRFIVLESVAGIPGSVAGFVRHLNSMRMFRRDMAFIETLYDEAYNERMHLLTFLKMGKPTWRTRFMLWFGQGLFANCFFLTYLVSPKTCHRFVGYLEEQAVATYSRCIRDLELGLCPELANAQVPQIAKDYWHLSDDAKMYDLILYIRADEAKHREVNHTFANLAQDGSDRNPFALHIDSNLKQPSNTLENHKANGWERKDLIL